MPTANFTVSRTRVTACMAKLESTYGTDPTPAAATDDVLTYDSPVSIKPTSDRFEFRPHGTSFTRQADIISMRRAEIQLNSLLSTSGVNGTIAVNGFAGLDALLSACGATTTPSAGTNITLKPSTIAALQSATIWAKTGAFIHKANGVVMNCIMTGNPRGGVQCQFRGTGLYAAPVAVSTTFDAWTGGTQRAKAFLGVGATINNGSSFTPVLRNFTHDFGVEITLLENANATTGLEGIFQIDRNPTLELTIAKDDYGSATITYDEWFTDWLSAGPTTHAVAFTVSTGVNAIAASYPTAQLIMPDIRDNGGIHDLALMYKLQHATAETEWLYTLGA